MKKLLSLLLVLSLCLSSVILLASCTGKSAYEVAVENGFQGDEKAWLESLKGEKGEAGKKGADGKDGKDGDGGLGGTTGDNAFERAQAEGYRGDITAWLQSLYGAAGKNGHVSKIEVDENGYWVIDGTKQPVRVDGKKLTPTAIELVQSVYSVVKSENTETKLEINVKYNDGSVEKLPVAMGSMVTGTVDFTKEGNYPITITYAGLSVETSVKVEGLMVIYENFDSFSNSATMEEILIELGWKVPYGVVGQGNANASSREDVMGNIASALNGANLEAVTYPGGLHRPNYIAVKAVDGRLLIDNFTYNEGVLETNGKTAYDGALILADGAYMKACYADSFTIQYDMEFLPEEDSTITVGESVKKSKGSLYIGAYYGNNADSTIPYHVGYHIGVAGTLHERIRWGANSKGTNSWVHREAFSFRETLFANSASVPTDIRGQKITVKMVFVNDITDSNYGLNLYFKPEGGEFILISSMANEEMGSLLAKYTELRTNEKFQGDTWQMLDITMATGGMVYIDNFAVWTGVGDMPINTSTSLYEELIVPAA